MSETSKNKIRYDEARHQSDNWISYLCELEPLISHGKSAAELDQELQEASAAYLSDLVLRLGMFSNFVSRKSPKKVVAAYHDGKSFYLRIDGEEGFRKLKENHDLDNGVEEIIHMLSHEHSMAYLSRGIDVRYAVSVGNVSVDFDKLFYPSDEE